MDVWNEDPIDILSRLAEERRSLSDEALLAELASIPPLPADVGDTWQSADPWRHAYLLVAISDLVAERQLRSGVPLILERMCFGDPGEMMRGIRHALEEAAAEDWLWLAEACERATNSPHAGARLWATEELSVLREPRALPQLVRLLDDPEQDVAEQAAIALNLTARDHAECRTRVLGALRDATNRRPALSRPLSREIQEIESYSASP